jgi:hypothetical protein
LICGETIDQLSVAPSNVPWTSTTGAGCAALGRHVKSLAPGGDVAAGGR